MEIVGKTINTKGFVKMPSKMLELKSELEVHLSPTPRGIGVTLAPETPGKAASYAEYHWAELIGGLCEAHTIPVLHDKDVRITEDSYKYLLEVVLIMKQQSDLLLKKAKSFTIVN